MSRFYFPLLFSLACFFSSNNNCDSLSVAETEWVAQQPHQQFVYISVGVKECIQFLSRFDPENRLMALCADLIEVLEHNMHIMPYDSAHQMIEYCKALLHENAASIEEKQWIFLQKTFDSYEDFINQPEAIVELQSAG